MATVQINDENRADFKCKARQDMMPDLELVRDVERGTPAIRAGRTKYLPKWPGERTSGYNQRLAHSSFFNAYRKIRNGIVGMVCKTNPILGDDIPPEIKTHLENIDLAGTHIDVFVKELLQKALEGHVFVFVDMEKPLPPGSTAYQAQKSGRRPYWNMYTKDLAFNWLSDRINGEEVLTQITFEEHAPVKAGRYGEKVACQYRTLWLPVLLVDEQGYPTLYGPMQWELKRKNPKDNTEQVIDKGTTKLDRLPVVVVYTNKRGFLISDPYLIEIAYLNLEHYKKWSYLDTQEKALVPILVHKEVDPPNNGRVPKDNNPPVNETRQIGPNVVFKLTGENDELKWESHDSKGVDSARQSLIDIEQRISALSLSIIAPKDKVAVTATDKLLDQGERISELGTMARALQDGIESLLGIHARMIGKADKNGDGGSITIVVDDSPTVPAPAPQDPKMPGVGLPVADAERTAAATSAVN